MTAERGDNAGVRLHVGGLARGVDPKELAALIARALPPGASPTAEIMRDASTGIERGFGYVSVPAGEGVKAGAEQAIAAYNGSRWRGNKIRVGFAKGDYLQRLKAEWDETAKAKEAAAAAAVAREAPVTTPYKARPALRLRRRPGERIILVDPTPVAWTKPPREDARAWAKRKEKEAREKEEKERRSLERGRGGGVEEAGDGGQEEEAGPHRRKRGVLGCRRRVEFPGRAATCSTPCRELWRRHLQERAAEASAARQRSVERFLSGMGGAKAAVGHAVPNGEALPPREGYDEAEHLPVEDAADLAPEEPPPAEGIEFVWDDAAEAVEGSESDDVGDVEGEESDGGGDGPGDDLGEAEQASSLSSSSFGGEPKPEEKESQAAIQGEQGGSEEYETPAAAGGWADGLGKGDDRVPPKAPEAWGGGAASGRPVSKKLERLGNNHGLELDDRLAALLSDGSDEDDEETYEIGGGSGGYDYELETAKRAGIGATNAAAEGTVEGMRDRLQAETERSLGLLAELFGGDSVTSARPAGGTAVAASSSAPAPVSVGKVAEDDATTSAGALSSTSVASEAGGGVGVGSSDVDTVSPKTEEQQRVADDDQAPLPGEGSIGERKSREAAAAPGGEGEERFVAHLPKLADIFSVQDKVSTKKNREEKEKDKAFKVTSLFGGLLPGAEDSAGPAAERATAAGTGGFSFAFGGGGVSVPAARADAGGAPGATAGAAEGQAAPANNGLIVSVQSSGLGGGAQNEEAAAVAAAGTLSVGDVSRPGLTPAAAAPAAAETFLWRPLGDVVGVGALFVRAGKREEVEAAWLGERRALTQDFKRKHKDAVKGRRGAGGGGGAVSKKRRR